MQVACLACKAQHHTFFISSMTDIWVAVRTPNTRALSTASSFTLNIKADGPAASTEVCCIQLLASSWGRGGVPGGVQGPLPCLLQVWQARPLGPELHRLPARWPSKPCALWLHPPLPLSGPHAQPHALPFLPFLCHPSSFCAFPPSSFVPRPPCPHPFPFPYAFPLPPPLLLAPSPSLPVPLLACLCLSLTSHLVVRNSR